MQQEKPGQEMCWVSNVALPKCLLVCLLLKGVTGYEERMPSPITTVDCLLTKQLCRGKHILVSCNPKLIMSVPPLEEFTLELGCYLHH